MSWEGIAEGGSWRAYVGLLLETCFLKKKKDPKHHTCFSIPHAWYMPINMFDSYVLFCTAAAAAESFQLCPTLCDPIDGSPPGSPVSGILQARTLEWVAISFSNA